MGLEALAVRDVVVRYGELVAVDRVSFTVGEGEAFGLLGPNGAGKTTLMNVIAGLLEPSEGEVLVKGLRPLEAKGLIGLCPQEPALYESLTGMENLRFYAELHGAWDQSKARRLLEELGLGEVANRRVATYSGGMKKRLNLAIALIHDPPLLVLDEPTTGMDPAVRREVWNYVKELKRAGRSVVLATHYMEEADELCDRVAIMYRGRVVALGSPEELKSRFGPEAVVEVRLLKPSTRALEAAGRVEGVERVEEAEWGLTVHARGVDERLPKIVEAMVAAGASIESVKVRKPTLEDVLLKLTGARLSEEG